MQNIKRAAYGLSAKSSPHGALSMVLYEQKAFHDELLKVIATRTNVMSALLKWVSEEENLAIKDVYARMAELEWMWSKIMHEVVAEEVNYRKMFKSLLAEEKSVDEFRKVHAAAEGKVEKIQKQIESTKGSRLNIIKSEKSKIEALDYELANALGKAGETGAALEKQHIKLEKQKALMVKEALITHTRTYLKISEKSMDIYKAQTALAELIPNTPTRYSNRRLYNPEESERIIDEMTQKLQLGEPPGSITDPVYQPWDDQSTQPSRAPPNIKVRPDGKTVLSNEQSRPWSVNVTSSSSDLEPPDLPPRHQSMATSRFSSTSSSGRSIPSKISCEYIEVDDGYLHMHSGRGAAKKSSSKSDPGDLAFRPAPPLPQEADGSTADTYVCTDTQRKQDSKTILSHEQSRHWSVNVTSSSSDQEPPDLPPRRESMASSGSSSTSSSGRSIPSKKSCGYMEVESGCFDMHSGRGAGSSKSDPGDLAFRPSPPLPQEADGSTSDTYVCTDTQRKQAPPLPQKANRSTSCSYVCTDTRQKLAEDNVYDNPDY